MTDNDGKRQTREDGTYLSEDEKRERLTTSDIFDQFIASGVKRSIRSIERYADPKSKRMVCDYDLGDRQYYCTSASVDALIQEEREVDERKKAHANVPPPPPPTSDTTSQGHTSQRQQGIESEDGDTTTTGSERELRAKIRRLEIDAEVNKRYIEKLETERETVFDKFTNLGRQIGSLENQVTQIEAPKPQGDIRRHDASEFRDADYTVTPPESDDGYRSENERDDLD